MWKRGNGIRATYKVLLTAFVDTNNHDAADELVNCLNGTLNWYTCVGIVGL